MRIVKYVPISEEEYIIIITREGAVYSSIFKAAKDSLRMKRLARIIERMPDRIKDTSFRSGTITFILE